MLIKSKLHASQLYIPKDFLAKLSIDKESDVYLEFDENINAIIITAKTPEIDTMNWILQATANPPKPQGGDAREDLKEYDYNDV